MRGAAVVFCLSVLLGGLIPAQAEALNAMKHAEQLFNAAKYADAVEWYKTELSKNPQNSTAHYMLGVSLAKLNRGSEAIQQFNLAKQCDKSGAISGYSDQYLKSLTGANLSVSKNTPSDPQRDSSKLQEKNSETSKSGTNTQSAENIGKVSTSSSSALEAECAKEIDRIEKDANQNIQELTAKAEKSLAEVPRSQYRNTGSYYADQAIKAEYQRAVNDVRDQAERKEAEVKAHYRARQTAIEDSAYAMHKNYESKNQVGKIILSPVGTNMNVRNYQTSDEPSGSDVPVVAAPAKTLPTKKK